MDWAVDATVPPHDQQTCRQQVSRHSVLLSQAVPLLDTLCTLEHVSQRLELELDDTTAAYLRQRCARRGDLAGTAAAVLRELALRDAVDSLVGWHRAHPDYATQADEEYEQALGQAS
jgi:hypothetical protein